MRQRPEYGVLNLWHINALDVNPFSVSQEFTIQRNVWMAKALNIRDHIRLGTRSILIRKYLSNRCISQKRIPIQEFTGIALRISARNRNQTTCLDISINLHHEKSQFCIPLYFANDMDVTGARIQTWARTLKLPILLPDSDGQWVAQTEPLGRLVMREPFPRSTRIYLANRKAVLPTYRETCTINPQNMVTGKEISAWD